ncbi:MAG: bactoprenol glucosyl transferase [Desulfovibrio sp. MES5]|uniref:glycosyltransferase family 2 protein n=1 Tax=Desulfovibrio sp. MES5 TaxID=1899016 RepID=UPI000B9D43DD|nr:glycosyltransferase family 2 protein [Desulfovibrio sp. MES5]OXS30173.1 MAG: bactoprenol glucosyl transferase [Desulfovibrio sp. MES5]
MYNAELAHGDTASLSLSLVVPVYNEADVIDIFVSRINEVFADAPHIALELVFVNDGSTDNTAEALARLCQHDSRVRVIELSRNFGKEAALTAGLDHVAGQVVVPMDVDLQDPPQLIFNMIDKWREGYDVVLGRRANRDSDTWTKRTFAQWFYSLHNMISSPKLPVNVGDFRLMDRRVVEALRLLPESRRFMKGLFAWLGFRTCHVDYVRPARVGGTTKFNGWRLWNFALEGFTSFSTAPLRVWTYVGMVISAISFLYAMIIALKVILLGVDVPGYASMMVAITFLGGLQLIGIGILGEYLGRTYLESKRRPTYVVRRILNGEKRPEQQ